MQKILLIISLLIVSVSLQGEIDPHLYSKGEIKREQTGLIKESKKSHAYWKKMAEGMSRALMEHF